jgi:hypothetical protein
MADISILQRLVNGANRNVNIGDNTLVVTSIKVGGNTSNTELTKTILDNLISHLSDTANPHSVTKTQVGLGNVDNVQQLPMSYLDTDGTLAANSDVKVASQKATKTYVDTAVAAASGSQVKVSAADTTSEYLNASLTVSNGTNSTNPLEKSIVNPGSNEQLNIKFDQSKVDHGSITGLADDDHTQYHNDARGDARYYQKSEFVTTSTAGAPVKLDGGGKISAAQLPNTVMELQGFWSAATNTPTLADGTGNPGDIYEVTAGGTVDFGSGNITFAIGDWAVYAADGKWHKSINSNEVQSVFGRTGAVTAQSGDYTASQVTNTPAGNIAATTVQAAINELDSEKFASADFNSTFDTRLGTKSTTDLAEGTNLYFTDERAQDAVAAMIVDTATIDFTYTDATPELKADVKDNSISAAKLTTGVADQATITGGNGSALAVQYAPKIVTSEVAGEALAATTLFALRYAMGAETASRAYKATKDASVDDKFYVLGLILTTSAVSAADPIVITRKGLLTVASHGFTVGAPIYLSAAGAVTSTAPSTATEAVVRLGMVKDANTLDIDIQVVGVN